MTTPSKADRIRAAGTEIRFLISKLRPGSVRAPESQSPKIERFKDGTPKDRLIALEEKIDMERAVADLSYYEANRSAILEVRRLREVRVEEGRIAAEERARVDRQVAYREKEAAKFADEQARVAANDAAKQAAIDESFSRPPGA